MPYQTLAPSGAMATNPRIQPEIILRYSLLDCPTMGDVLITGSGSCTFTASDETIPSGNANYYLFVLVKSIIGASQIVLTINGQDYGSGPKSGTVTIPATSGYDEAFLVSGGDGWGSILTVTCTGGTLNDQLEIWAVPDVDQYTRWRYLRDYNLNVLATKMAVPDGFDPAYTSILQRRGFEMSIGRDYVDFGDGLDVLRGREMSLIAEIHPGGGGNISTYVIMPQAIISAAQGAPDNAMVTTSGDGSHRAVLMYEPSS